MADFLTYQNIIDQIEQNIKALKGSKETLIQGLVNMVYFEMIEADDQHPLFWLRDFDDSLAAKAPGEFQGITTAATGVVLHTAHSYVTDDLISLRPNTNMDELRNRVFRVVKIDADSYSLKDTAGNTINTASYTACADGGYTDHRGVKLATTNKNVEKIICAAFHSYDPMKIITDPKLLEGSTQYWGDNTQRPEACMQLKRYATDGTETNWLMWFPGSDQAYLALRCWFSMRVSPLSATTDVPVLPPRFHPGIVAGVITRLIEHGTAQVENAVIWPALYKMHVESLVNYNTKLYKDAEADNMPAPFGL